MPGFLKNVGGQKPKDRCYVPCGAAGRQLVDLLVRGNLFGDVHFIMVGNQVQLRSLRLMNQWK